MDWKLILLLSVIGFIMGLLSVRGFTRTLEPFLWLLFGIAAALLISKNIDQKTFLHGFLVGLSWGIANGIIQSVFFDIYIVNNPQLQQNFQKVTFIKPRFFSLLAAPAIGLITGLALGGLSLLLRKLW